MPPAVVAIAATALASTGMMTALGVTMATVTLGQAILVGAVAGAVGSAAGAVVSGEKNILKAALKGAAFGGITGGIAHGLGVIGPGSSFDKAEALASSGVYKDMSYASKFASDGVEGSFVDAWGSGVSEVGLSPDVLGTGVQGIGTNFDPSSLITTDTYTKVNLDLAKEGGILGGVKDFWGGLGSEGKAAAMNLGGGLLKGTGDYMGAKEEASATREIAAKQHEWAQVKDVIPNAMPTIAGAQWGTQTYQPVSPGTPGIAAHWRQNKPAYAVDIV